MPVDPGSGAVRCNRHSFGAFFVSGYETACPKYRLIGTNGMAFLARTMH
jgi:hypothetical protein